MKQRIGTIRGKITQKTTEKDNGVYLFTFTNGETHEIPYPANESDTADIKKIRAGMTIVITYDDNENYIPGTIGW